MAIFGVFADYFHHQVCAFPKIFSHSLRMFREHEDDVRLSELSFTQTNSQRGEKHSAQIGGSYKGKQQVVEELHDQLMGHFRRRQNLNLSIAEFDEPACITSQRKIILFA